MATRVDLAAGTFQASRMLATSRLGGEADEGRVRLQQSRHSRHSTRHDRGKFYQIGARLDSNFSSLTQRPIANRPCPDVAEREALIVLAAKRLRRWA
jgi:hypothetical protein